MSSKSAKDFSKEYFLKELNVHPKELPMEFFEYHKIPHCSELIEYNLRNKIACDTTIIIGKETFQCHSIVLKVHTNYFMISEEAGFSMEKIELSPTDVSMESFREIYDWMLNEDYSIPRPKFADIFKSAVFLKIRDLIKECMAIIDSKELIDEREAVAIFLEAKRVNCPLLQSHVITKISRIFLTFVSSLDFLELSFNEIVEFFKSHGIAVNSEMDMMYVALRWLEFDWPKRAECVRDLFKLIKFDLMPLWILTEIKKYPKYLAHIFILVEDILENTMRERSYLHTVENGEKFKI